MKRQTSDAHGNKTKTVLHFRQHLSAGRVHSPTPWLSFISVNTHQLDDTTVPLPDCPLFPSTPINWTIPGSFFLTVKSLGDLLGSSESIENLISQTFKSCCYQLWRIISVRKYVPPRLQWDWSHCSYCHALTTAILSFFVCLLHLSIAFVAFRTVLLVPSLKKCKTDTVTPLSISPLAPDPAKSSVHDKHSAINVLRSLLCLISVTVFNFTHSPAVLSTQPPDSSLQTFHCCFSHLFWLHPLYIQWPSPSSPTETFSGWLQIQPQDGSFPKTIDLPCFAFRAVVFLRLVKSLLS